MAGTTAIEILESVSVHSEPLFIMVIPPPYGVWATQTTKSDQTINLTT